MAYSVLCKKEHWFYKGEKKLLLDVNIWVYFSHNIEMVI